MLCRYDLRDSVCLRLNSSNVIEAVNGGHLPGAIGTNEHHSVSIAEH